MKAKWKDESFRIRNIASVSVSRKKKSYKEEKSRITKEQWESYKLTELHSENMKKAWIDKSSKLGTFEYSEKMAEGVGKKRREEIKSVLCGIFKKMEKGGGKDPKKDKSGIRFGRKNRRKPVNINKKKEGSE